MAGGDRPPAAHPPLADRGGLGRLRDDSPRGTLDRLPSRFSSSVAMLAFGSELVPAEGWASAGGRKLAQLRLFSKAHARLGNILALLATHQLRSALADASATENGTITSAAFSSDSSADATEQGKTRRCAFAGCPNCATLICGACASVCYCGKACQKLHWPAHGRRAGPGPLGAIDPRLLLRQRGLRRVAWRIPRLRRGPLRGAV
jgi:hypothetical protein